MKKVQQFSCVESKKIFKYTGRQVFSSSSGYAECLIRQEKSRLSRITRNLLGHTRHCQGVRDAPLQLCRCCCCSCKLLITAFRVNCFSQNVKWARWQSRLAPLFRSFLHIGSRWHWPFTRANSILHLTQDTLIVSSSLVSTSCSAFSRLLEALDKQTTGDAIAHSCIISCECTLTDIITSQRDQLIR